MGQEPPQGSWNAKTNESRFLPFMVTQHGGNCYQECAPDSGGHKTGARAPVLLEGTGKTLERSLSLRGVLKDEQEFSGGLRVGVSEDRSPLNLCKGRARMWGPGGELELHLGTR